MIESKTISRTITEEQTSNNKIKILSAILHNRIKVINSYNEYNKLKNNNVIDIESSVTLKNKGETFQVNLYNYARSIMDKKSYFKNSNKIKIIFEKKFFHKTKKGEFIEYKFSDLYNAFRNRNEHFDKIDYEDEYIGFKANITIEMLEKLLLTCDEVLNDELNELTDDEMLRILLENIDVQFFIYSLMNRFELINPLVKKQNLLIYNLNVKILEYFDKIKFKNITKEKIEAFFIELQNCLKCSEYKKEFIAEYGEKIYNQLLSFFEDNSNNIDEYKKKLNDFFVIIVEHISVN